MKQMDHSAYQRRLKQAGIESLHYIMKDAREAINAQPFGENAGYYADEIHYAAMELQRRGLDANGLPPFVRAIGINT